MARDKNLTTPDARERRAPYLLILIFALLASGIVAAGYVYYRSYEKRTRSRLEAQLSTVAALKVNELIQWRKERLADAKILSASPSFVELVQKALNDPRDSIAHDRLAAWLALVQTNYDYEGLVLLDANGIQRMSVPSGKDLSCPASVTAATEAMRSGRDFFLDFHRGESGGAIHLGVVAPIVDDEDGGKAIGAIILRIDPARYLYPLIQRWPAPSATAETLLTRRDNGDALFLNELRFVKDTALALRIPLEKKDTPAVQAVLGREGIVEGRDYRGVPVVAALRAVSGSPWFLVAKMDEEEAFARSRQQALFIGVLILGLLLAAGSSVAFIWRQQSLGFYREKYHAAEAVRESEDKFKYVFEGSLLGNSITLPSGEIQVNRAFCEMLGYPKEELMRKKWQEITYPDDIAPTQRELDPVLAGEKEGARFTKRYVHKSGSIVWADVITSLRRDKDGKPMYFMTAVNDISERTEAETALRESESRFRQLVNSLPQLVWTCQPDGPCDSLSQQWVSYTGVEEAPQLDFGWLEQIHPDDRAPTVAAWQAAVASGAEFRVEFRIRRHDGEYRWFDTRAVRLRDAQGRTVKWFGSNTDVTDRKRAEESAQRMMEDLERSNRELEQFAYVASHDLQEPLRMISSYTQLLGERYRDHLDERAKKYIDYAVDGATRMQRLINDLLLYSRVGTRGAAPALMDSHAALGEALRNLATAIQESHALVTNDDLPEVVADEPQLIHLFQNLVGNAIKFHGEAPPRIHVSATEQGGQWLFSVRDNGIGIEPQYRDKVFVIFQRLHNRQDYPGTGIGLALCKRIVERHRGTIRFESDPGKGTTFLFTLPK